MAQQPDFRRPVVADVQFEYKSARTPEGWPVECIKAGGLQGLTAYACFYASRAKRPQLMGPNQSRIGLDPDFCHVFWAELPGFASIPALVGALVAYARSPLTSGDRTAALTVADGLAFGLSTRNHVFGWLHSVAQVELLAGARLVAAALRETLLALPGNALTALELSALGELDEVLAQAGELCTALARQGLTTCSAPRLDRTLHGLGWPPAAAALASPGAALLAPHSAVPPACPVDASTRVDSLWGMPFECLASAWTHVEARLFSDIPYAEWREAGWDRSRYEHASDGVRRFVDHFNACALWVTAEVLARDSPEARAATITRFIQVMSTLRRLNNFSALFQVATGLRRDSVARLSATWALVPQAALERWAVFQALADDKRSYAAYRVALRELLAAGGDGSGASPSPAHFPPLVPHLGAHTAEMTMADQQLPTHVPPPGAASSGGSPPAPPEHIHFRRYRELSRLHAGMVGLQRRGYGPTSSLGPLVASALQLLASHTRAFYFFSDERREEAVAALAARSRAVEPSQADRDEAAAAAAAAARPGSRSRRFFL